ncbi:PAX-interacting protein 1-like isoform X2 [Corticium candelabrum]|uniref:PAX-interacting protein 1-like isoform X2 n=1 Tax=Corticium candelabrum TaxID=121492 RepID=UPI002E26934E|nr:PAX-interacting protein 1-like isoform X2 [Corticium candelabrum]
MAMVDVPSNLFESVHYYVARDDDRQTRSLLRQGGANREFSLNERVTHIIAAPDILPSSVCNDTIFQAVTVKPEWVTMSVKCRSLLPTDPFVLKSDQLFSGVVVCPSQMSEADRHSVLAMVTFYGGRYQARLNSKCSHLVTPGPFGAKYACAVKHSDTVKVVTPEWIIDSIKAGHCLDERNYSVSPPVSATENVADNNVEIRNAEKEGNSLSVAAPSVELPNEYNRQHDLIEDKDNQNLSMDTACTDVSTTDCFLKSCCFVFVDYPKLVGEETIKRWSQFITSHGGTVLSQYNMRECSHVLACSQSNRVFARAYVDGTKIATLYWLSDVLMQKRLSPPTRPLHLPVPFTTDVGDCRSMNICCSGFTVTWQRRHVKDMIMTVGAKYSANMTRSNSHLICKRPSGEKYTKAKEWGIVIVNARWLADIVSGGVVPDPCHSKYKVTDSLVDEFCLDTSIPDIQWMLSCWGEDVNSTTTGKQAAVKRTASEAELSPASLSQKRKSERSNRLSYCGVPAVMFTGLESAEVKRLTKMIVKLGGRLAESEMTCTHLVTKEIHRTIKFLSAISVCHFVVRPEWLEQSFTKSLFLEENDFLVRDTIGEQQWQLSLERTLELAHQRPLLEGAFVYATSSVMPSPSQLKTIVECAGGTMLTVLPTSRGETLPNGHPSVIVISCPADRLQCRPFFEAKIDIYLSEFILTGVLRQTLDYSSNRMYPS